MKTADKEIIKQEVIQEITKWLSRAEGNLARAHAGKLDSGD